MAVEKTGAFFEASVNRFILGIDPAIENLAKQAFKWYLLPRIKEALPKVQELDAPIDLLHFKIGHFAWQALSNEVARFKMLGLKSEALSLAQFSLQVAAKTYQQAEEAYAPKLDGSATSKVELDLVLRSAADLGLSVADIDSLTAPSNKPVALTLNQFQAFNRATTILTSFKQPVKTLLGNRGAQEISHALAIHTQPNTDKSHP